MQHFCSANPSLPPPHPLPPRRRRHLFLIYTTHSSASRTTHNTHIYRRRSANTQHGAEPTAAWSSLRRGILGHSATATTNTHSIVDADRICLATIGSIRARQGLWPRPGEEPVTISCFLLSLGHENIRLIGTGHGAYRHHGGQGSRPRGTKVQGIKTARLGHRDISGQLWEGSRRLACYTRELDWDLFGHLIDREKLSG